MIFFILAGSMFLTGAMSFTGIPRQLAAAVGGQGFSPGQILFVLTLLMIVLGCFIDGISIVVLTTSVLMPVIEAAKIDPLWFGIYMVFVVEIGLVTPPVGFNLFVIQSLTKRDLPYIARAALPYFLAMCAAVIVGPVAFLVALPLARRFGWFWAEIPGHVRERAIGDSEWRWEAGRGATPAGEGPAQEGLPIRVFIFTPFIVLALVMVGATAVVALRSGENDAARLATRLHQEGAANIRMRLDDYLAASPSLTDAQRADGLVRLLRNQAVGTNGRAFILDRTGAMTASRSPGLWRTSSSAARRGAAPSCSSPRSRAIATPPARRWRSTPPRTAQARQIQAGGLRCLKARRAAGAHTVARDRVMGGHHAKDSDDDAVASGTCRPLGTGPCPGGAAGHDTGGPYLRRLG
jgi:hypothetical protein